jgi:cation diffusion facilitator family transporter
VRRRMIDSGRAGVSEGDREKRLVALSSVVAAVLLTSMKIVVGVTTGSLGILSEAAHSTLDLIAAVVTFWAVRVSGKPADPEHTYGHAKFENISALFETVLLFATCIWIAYEAIERLFFHATAVKASIWGFVVMGTSILIDVSRSRALGRVAKKYGSQALEADALHFSSDILSSSVVILGLGGVFLSSRLDQPWLAKADAMAAMAVAGIVMVMSVRLGKKSVDDLLDSAPLGLQERLFEIARVPGVIDVKKLRVRRAGPETFADVTVTIGRNVAFEKAHHVAKEIQASFLQVLGGGDVVVHVEPVAEGNDGIVTTARLLAARHSMGAHDIQVLEEDGRLFMEIHLEMDESLTLSEAHGFVTSFENALLEAVPKIEKVVTHIDPVGEVSALQRSEPADDRPVRDVLEMICLERGPGFRPRNLAVRRTGDALSVSFVLPMPPTISIAEAHEAGELVEKDLRGRLTGLDRVVIRVEPWEEAPSDRQAVTPT